MNTLNDLTAISYDMLTDWLQKRQKSDKHVLKRMHNKLLTQLITFDHKLNNYREQLDRDPDNAQIQSRLNQLKSIITEYEQYIDLVNRKILSFQVDARNRLSSIQHQELALFKDELENMSEKELNDTVFTELTKAQAQYFREIQALDKKDALLTDEEYTSWTEQRNQAKNAYTFMTFKLRSFEKQWFNRRINKIATLPTQIQDQTDDFFYDLRHHRDEKLMFLKAKYKKKLALNHNNPSHHHENTQLDVFITAIQLELRSRHIKRPKPSSKRPRGNSPASVIPNPQNEAHPITEEKENHFPIIQYKTTKVKVLFHQRTTSVSEAPQRPATPSNFC